MSVGRYVSTYVRPSVRPSTKSFPDFNEIWYLDRGGPFSGFYFRGYKFTPKMKLI